jgi:ribonuclease D
LKLTLDKTFTQADWKQNPLPPKLLQHAARDAKFGMCLLEAMMPLAKQVSATSKVLSPCGVASLKTGDLATCNVNGD